ncbi:MAG: AtpZ/AtpI family protein [Bacteroidota bacterium]
MESNKDSPKKKLDTWIKFSNIGLQMAVTIGAMAYLGVWLDEKYPNLYSVYTVVFSLIGVFASLYNVFRQVRNMNDKE